jgi:hypothetical protein
LDVPELTDQDIITFKEFVQNEKDKDGEFNESTIDYTEIN